MALFGVDATFPHCNNCQRTQETQGDISLKQFSFLCGANRDRTGDLRRARAALSRLSYSPLPFLTETNFEISAEEGSFRSAVSRFIRKNFRNSYNLRYMEEYIYVLFFVSGQKFSAARAVGLSGVEPLTSRLSGVRSNHS